MTDLRRLVSAALTVLLLPTAAVALVLALSAAMNHGEPNWWLVGYALVAGGWGMHRAADAQPTPVADEQMTEWWRAATAAEQARVRDRWADTKGPR